jgi:hypothetical protein
MVRILGQRIQTFVGPDRVHQTLAATGERAHHSAVGIALTQHGVVAIESHQSEDQVADTVLHEWLHVMGVLAGVDSERVVSRLTPILLDFMRRNPRAVEYLLGEPFRVVRW